MRSDKLPQQVKEDYDQVKDLSQELGVQVGDFRAGAQCCICMHACLHWVRTTRRRTTCGRCACGKRSCPRPCMRLASRTGRHFARMPEGGPFAAHATQRTETRHSSTRVQLAAAKLGASFKPSLRVAPSST